MVERLTVDQLVVCSIHTFRISMLYLKKYNKSNKRRGAVEACLAHNQKVGGSKPPVAIYLHISITYARVAQSDSASDF